MATEITSQGVRKHYGPRDAETSAPSTVVTAGEVKELVVPFTYNDLPTTSELDNLILSIPALAFILSSHLHVDVAFVGGTSYNIGLSQADGTVVDADGIDAAVATAALTAGAWVVNDGALVGASVGANPVQVTAAATGTYTAGSGKLVIRYLVA